MHTRTMRKPTPWAMMLWGLSVGVLGLFLGGSTAYAEEDNVSFLWSFAALVETGGVKQPPVAITQDTILKAGDHLKLAVELRKPCFVYVIYHGAQGEVKMLFPSSVAQFTTDYQLGKKYEVPPGSDWLKLNDQVGRETFYLVAAAQRLSDLEKLLEMHAAAKPEERAQAATNIVTEIRDLRKRHRQFATPAERPVPIAGNMRIDIPATEIAAHNFYSKTFTIENR